jgi:hypothetical protein
MYKFLPINLSQTLIYRKFDKTFKNHITAWLRLGSIALHYASFFIGKDRFEANNYVSF